MRQFTNMLFLRPHYERIRLFLVFGHLDVVRYLASRGANIAAVATNGSGYSPLLTAAANGHLGIVNLLLAHGADPNAVTNDGKSATALASERNHPQVVARL